MAYKTGTFFDQYMKIPVKVTGTGSTPGEIVTIEEKDYKCESFEEMQFEEQLLLNVKEYGYAIPTPVQKRYLTNVLQSF